jgi:hypothetical protein
LVDNQYRWDYQTWKYCLDANTIYNKYIIRRYTTSFGKSIAWSPAPADQ